MSTVSDARRPARRWGALDAGRLTRVRAAISSDPWVIAGLVVFAAILLALTWGTWGNINSDAGYDVVAGVRVAHGEMPYAGFIYYYGPLAPLLAGLAAAIGGSGLAPAIALGLIITAGITALTYALAREFVSPIGAGIATAMTLSVALAPHEFGFVLPYSFAPTLGTLCLLILSLGLVRYSRTGAVAWLVAAGAGAGLATLTKPEFATAAAVGVVVWLVLRHLSVGGLRRDAVALLAPAVAIPAAVYGAFLLAVSPGRLVFDNLYPRDELSGSISEALRSHTPMTLSSFAELGGRLALYAAGIAGLLLLAWGINQGGRLRRLALIAGGVAAAGAIALSFARPETLRWALGFAYGWIPLGALVAIAVVVLRRRGRAIDSETALQATLLAILAVLAAFIYAAFFMFATFPQIAVFAVPFAAVFLVRLHLVELGRTRAHVIVGMAWLVFLVGAGTGLTLADASAESATVRGPGGAIATTPARAPVYDGALSWIARTTTPGEPILIAPVDTLLYALSGRESPLPRLSLLPGALPTDQSQQDAIERLDRAHVRLIITDRREFWEYGNTSFGKSFQKELASWIRANFTHRATLAAVGTEPLTLDVWTRSGK